MANYTFDCGVYGATIGGLMAAIKIAKRGLNVVVLEWSPARGGMTEGGLGGAMDFIRDPHRSGLTKEWYERVTAIWLAENPDWASKPGTPGQTGAYWDWNVPDYLSKNRILFAPGHGRQATDAMLAGLPITIIKNIWISSVEKTDTGMTVHLTNGDSYKASNWQDASYEVDLSRMCGVPRRYGRDRLSTYNETSAGLRVGEVSSLKMTDANGDVWPVKQMPPKSAVGSADQMDMGFVFRMTISKHANRLPFPKPPGYRRTDFLWFIEECQTKTKFESISSYKRINDYLFGTNGPSLHGLSWGYSQTKTRAERLAFWDRYFYIQSGMYWTAQNDSAVPQALRDDVALHGLPHDHNQAVGDYYGTPGWSSQLYVREAGSMVTSDVVTEKNILSQSLAMGLDDPINMHGYGMDSHLFREYPTPDNKSVKEGSLSEITGEGLYQIGLKHVKAPKAIAPNLLVSWGFSQSRSVMCSSRIEPPFQMQGEVCGLIQAIAAEQGVSIANVSYGMVKPELEAMGAHLTGLRTGGTD